MSKQVMVNERPSDNMGGGMGGGAGDDWPKASIGNYKGVMLCNRPNENGLQAKIDKGGLRAFNSRVNNVQLFKSDYPGWHPSNQLPPKQNKKKIDPNSILLRHKRFLKNLEAQKKEQMEMELNYQEEQDQKMNKFKETAAAQREKIRTLKDKENQMRLEQEQLGDAGQQEETLSQLAYQMNAQQDKQSDAKSQKSVTSSKKGGKKGGVPAWAKTQDQVEEEKEKEIDDLLEFAYELDYEQYMEDYEVRQALEIIKDRVSEIKKDEDWKKKIADEWNQATANEGGVTYEDIKREQKSVSQDQRSQITYKSSKSAVSKTSLNTQVREAKKKEQEAKPDWNGSVASKSDFLKPSTEDRVAQKIANEVLKENSKLRGVHSGQSIKELLKREAKRQLMLPEYKGPQVSIIKEKDLDQGKIDPSNLPYLHKNPAI